MKLLIGLSLAFLLSTPPSKVFICNSENAVAYHFDRECKGLGRCTHSISEVTVETAKSKGLHFCGYED